MREKNVRRCCGKKNKKGKKDGEIDRKILYLAVLEILLQTQKSHFSLMYSEWKWEIMVKSGALPTDLAAVSQINSLNQKEGNGFHWNNKKVYLKNNHYGHKTTPNWD